MRTKTYISPSGLMLYRQNKEEFYMKYLSDLALPDQPQTRPMSVGSSFDAYCKSYLHEKLIGKNPEFEFKTLFEAQVQSHNRDWALGAGKYCFDIYQKSGALADLMVDLQEGIGPPRFETEILGIVDNNMGGKVSLLGRPDVFFITKEGLFVILDWKVNGFCSNYKISPVRGYVRCRDITGKDTGPHKNAKIGKVDGFTYNYAEYFESVKMDWATQLTIYAWLCGTKNFVAAIDQLACSPFVPDQPDIRIAEHRLRVSSGFQERLLQECVDLWNSLHDGHFFKEMSLEQSQAKCAELDKVVIALNNKDFTDVL